MSKLARIYSDFQGGVLGEALPAHALLVENGRVPVDVQFAIYRDGYRIRLLGALRETYPATAAYMGNAEFDAFATRYIEAVAPNSYSIEYYPAGLANFDAALNEFTNDLIKLESAIHEVYWSKNSSSLSAHSFNKFVDKHLANQRLMLAASTQVLSFNYSVNDYLTAFREGEKLEVPEARKNYLLVTRAKNAVTRTEITEGAYRLLMELSAGKPVGEAIDAACVCGEEVTGQITKGIEGWFTQWIQLGVFARK